MGKSFFFVFFVLIFSCFSFVFIPEVRADPPDMTINDWYNYKILTICDKEIGSQMRIVIGNNTVDGGNVTCNGHIAQGNGFQDIRFVNTANTSEYYHWMESCVPDHTAVFWVNTSDNASTMNLYYNNSVCSNSTYRNPDNTFYLFSNVSDYASWSHTEKVEVYGNTVNEVTNIVGTAATQAYYAYLPFDSPISAYVINAEVNVSKVNTGFWGSYQELRDGDAAHTIASHSFTFANDNIDAYYNGGSKTLYGSIVADTYYLYEIYVNETTDKLRYVFRLNDYTYQGSTGYEGFYNADTDGMDRYWIYAGSGTPYSYNLSFKYLFITKWCVSIPYWCGVSDEQGSHIDTLAVNITFVYPVNQSTINCLTNISFIVYGVNPITYNASLRDYFFLNGTCTNNTLINWSFYYAVIDMDYTLFVNVSDDYTSGSFSEGFVVESSVGSSDVDMSEIGFSANLVLLLLMVFVVWLIHKISKQYVGVHFPLSVIFILLALMNIDYFRSLFTGAEVAVIVLGIVVIIYATYKDVVGLMER